jgi:hypothetical protein
MRRTLVAAAIAGFVGVGLAAPAFGATPTSAPEPGNPSVTGNPSQMCLSNASPQTPGNAALSPGSPFHEPGTMSPTDPGGNGGQHYAGNMLNPTFGKMKPSGNPVAAQYDVACYHQP